MPVSAAIRLGSAALQALADDHGVDLLHIKGPAVDTSLLEVVSSTDPDTGVTVQRARPRPSIDADILVRPSHVTRMFEAMGEHGWQLAFRFEDGSAFEHASTWVREGLASADVHRSFPGIGADPQAAFEHLWSERGQVLIAGYPCQVPSLAAQRLILILHAVRGGQLASGDILRSWHDATDAQRAEVDALALTLKAEVALAAATGRLEAYRHRREYALWQVLSTGDRSRLRLWTARVRAQPDPISAVRTAVWLVAPKSGRLRQSLGREPTLREIATGWSNQLGVAGRELRAALRRTRPGRSR